jgi:hypothetical protein
MNIRKPPRLANWLLNRSGVARQNPPLTGDLLEEFRNGRSAAWYWRQTLVVILTGLARNARLGWRPLTGIVIGWAIQTEVALALWWFHFPPYLSSAFWPLTGIAASWLLFRLVSHWTAPKAVPLATPPVPKGLAESAVDTFIGLLLSYCIGALLRRDMTQEDFIFLQGFLFLGALIPGTARILTKLKQP